MNKKVNFLDTYEINNKDLLKSKINAANSIKSDKKRHKDIGEKNSLESKSNHFKPSNFID